MTSRRGITRPVLRGRSWARMKTSGLVRSFSIPHPIHAPVAPISSGFNLGGCVLTCVVFLPYLQIRTLRTILPVARQ